MSWFTPKLEPGERLAWRYPEMSTGQCWAYLAIVPAVATVVMLGGMLWISSPENAVFAVINAATAGVSIASVNSITVMWRAALTDRRLLVRQSIFRRAPREILLHEIEEIRMNIAAGYGVARTADQEIMLPMELADLPKLKQAIEAAKGEAAP